MKDFEKIYADYYEAVFMYVMTLCRDKEIAEEVTQDAFFKAMKNIDTFRGDCKLNVWLCQIAKNTFLTSIKRKNREVDYSLELIPSDENLEQKLIDKDMALRIHKVLHLLDEPYKEIFWMRTFADLSFKEIGQLFSKTETWARVTYHRAKIKIKEEMKIECNVIKDLLPLYYDGVCSEESIEFIKKHLSECNSCNEYYKTICDSDKITSSTFDESKELEKAKSFKEVKKRLQKKQLIISTVGILLLVIAFFIGTMILKNNSGVVLYNDNNMSVHTIDGDLVGRLKGSVWEEVNIKTVETQNSGIKETYIIFYLIHNEWDNLISNDSSFTEFTIAYADKGADEIDRVYYYTGDFEGLEELSKEELENVIENSVLLWSK